MTTPPSDWLPSPSEVCRFVHRYYTAAVICTPPVWSGMQMRTNFPRSFWTSLRKGSVSRIRMRMYRRPTAYVCLRRSSCAIDTASDPSMSGAAQHPYVFVLRQTPHLFCVSPLACHYRSLWHASYRASYTSGRATVRVHVGSPGICTVMGTVGHVCPYRPKSCLATSATSGNTWRIFR